MKSENIWNAALSELQLQMTQATFDTWLRQSQFVRYENDVFVVGVHSGYAKDWLEHRLLGTIQRTLARLVGKSVAVEFVVAEAAPTSPDSPPVAEVARYVPLQEPGPGEVAVEVVEFDPTRKGFVMTANYAVRFWQPYLGSVPFSLWMTLKSYAFQSERNVWPSIQTLADICAGGNRHVILGRKACQGRKSQAGAAEILEREHVARVIVTGTGPKTRYLFRIQEALPLLTPTQVQRLSPVLRQAHDRFIKQCQIDHQEWQELTDPTLLPDTMSWT